MRCCLSGNIKKKDIPTNTNGQKDTITNQISMPSNLILHANGDTMRVFEICVLLAFFCDATGE